MLIDYIQPVLLAGRIMVRCKTGYCPFGLMIGKATVHPIELEYMTQNTASWSQ